MEVEALQMQTDTTTKAKKCLDPSKKPSNCDLILLENCMLQCKMCYMWQCKKDINQVPAFYYKGFIESLYSYFGSGIYIQFVGGEPLLKPDIIELIKCASEKGFYTCMTTNGYCINRKMALDLVEARFSSLTLSLDSLNKKLHDYYRGKHGVYKRVMKALKYFIGYRYPEESICIVTTIMDANIDDLVPLADWVENHEGIACISFQVVSQPFFTKEDPLWFNSPRFRFLWPQNKQKLFSALDQLIERKQKKYKIGNSVNQLNLFKKYFLNPEQFVKKGGCHLGYNSLSVNSAGDIYLCFEQPPIGNIMRNRIEDVWESPYANEVRLQIKSCKQNCKLMINCFSEEGFRI